MSKGTQAHNAFSLQRRVYSGPGLAGVYSSLVEEHG